MSKYTIFKDGVLARVLDIPDAALDSNVSPGEVVIPGDWLGYYLDGDTPVRIPESPSPLHMWNPTTHQYDLPPLDVLDDMATNEIDAAAAQIYNRFTRFDREYLQREQEAMEFKAADYTGPVPRQVAAFATPAGIPARNAADIILGQAASLRAAVSTLGELRMRKYEVYQATSAESKIAAKDSILAAIAAFSKTIT